MGIEFELHSLHQADELTSAMWPQIYS